MHIRPNNYFKAITHQLKEFENLEPLGKTLNGMLLFWNG